MGNALLSKQCFGTAIIGEEAQQRDGGAAERKNGMKITDKAKPCCVSMCVKFNRSPIHFRGNKCRVETKFRSPVITCPCQSLHATALQPLSSAPEKNSVFRSAFGSYTNDAMDVWANLCPLVPWDHRMQGDECTWTLDGRTVHSSGPPRACDSSDPPVTCRWTRERGNLHDGNCWKVLAGEVLILRPMKGWVSMLQYITAA